MAKIKRRAERLDGIDADNIRQMLESEGWQLTQQRIERTLETKIGEVQQPLDPVKTAEVRGFIQGLKLALSVPGILTKEAKGNRDGNTSDSL